MAGSAGWQDLLKSAQEAVAPVAQQLTGGDVDLSQADSAAGLRDALGQAVEQAVKTLGSKDGFLADQRVRIPLPEQLGMVKSGLAAVGQQGLADDFETSMNRAAEGAVHEAAPVLGKAVREMSFEDAKAILTGGDTAATDYLRRSSAGTLQERIRPLVVEATDAAGVTGYYKTFLDTAKPYLGMASGLLGTDVTDLDGYVTEKTVDGLFVELAAQEKQIRADPARWTTDALKKAFGALR